MKRVIVESPYGSTDLAVVQRNVEYARACMFDSLQRGESPLLSHLLYTQVLDDQNPEHRTMGIEAGLAWEVAAEATVAYVDLGITSGMEKGIARAHDEGREIETRRLGGRWAALHNAQ